tara:strand:+ start:320 stop:553 length:234 start_codon:yes stop_codon:yes gene_type:complete
MGVLDNMGGKINDLRINYLYLVQIQAKEGIWTFEISETDYSNPNRLEIWKNEKGWDKAESIKFGYGLNPDTAIWDSK